jgi:hypothetical protein
MDMAAITGTPHGRAGPCRQREPAVVRLAAAAAAVLAVVLCAVLVWRNALYGPDHDEYATLWLSDPSMPLAKLFRTRLSIETNPPLYYVLVRLLADWHGGDVLTIRLLNIGAILAAGLYALSVAWRRSSAGVPILCAVSLWFANVALFTYAPLARSYAMQLAACLVLARRSARCCWSGSVRPARTRSRWV